MGKRPLQCILGCNCSYMRHCPSIEYAEVRETRIRCCFPADGEVRLITITNKQFERKKVFNEKLRGLTENAPDQISFFLIRPDAFS